MPSRGARFAYRVLKGGVPAGAKARFDGLFKSNPVTAGRFGPVVVDGEKSTSQRSPYVSVNRGWIRHVSCANRPRLWRTNVVSRRELTSENRSDPFSAAGTVRKNGTCSYRNGLCEGESRR